MQMIVNCINAATCLSRLAKVGAASLLAANTKATAGSNKISVNC